MVLEHWQTVLISVGISLSLLAPWIRKQEIERKQLKWFQNLPLSEKEKIVTNEVTSDEALKWKLKRILKAKNVHL